MFNIRPMGEHTSIDLFDVYTSFLSCRRLYLPPSVPFVMRYDESVYSDSTASFTGNISEWEWSRGNGTNAYSLSYDDGV